MQNSQRLCQLDIKTLNQDYQKYLSSGDEKIVCDALDYVFQKRILSSSKNKTKRVELNDSLFEKIAFSSM